MALDPQGFPTNATGGPPPPAPAPAPAPVPAPAPDPAPQPADSAWPVDRSEIAAGLYVVQAAVGTAVSFGLHLSQRQLDQLGVLEGAVAALVIAYLIHRRGKAA